MLAGRVGLRDRGGGYGFLVLECKRLYNNRIQGWIFCFLTFMYNSKYRSSKDLAKLILCNANLHQTQYVSLKFWLKEGVLSLAKNSIYWKLKTKQYKLMMQLSTMTIKSEQSKYTTRVHKADDWTNFLRLKFQNKKQSEKIWCSIFALLEHPIQK